MQKVNVVQRWIKIVAVDQNRGSLFQLKISPAICRIDGKLCAPAFL